MGRPDPEEPDLDTVFALLSDARRRYLLYHLLENEYATVEQLSRRIAAWERDQSPRAVAEDDRKTVAVSLVHDHLPRLAEHGVVDYDDRNGDVVVGAGFSDVRPFLERTLPLEVGDEVPDPDLLTVLYSKPPEEPYAELDER